MYTPLYVKSNYSFFSSLIKIDDLVQDAKEKNIESLALCDDNMIGIMHFYKTCTNNNIKPIIGFDFTKLNNHILLYATNTKGYQNIIKISMIEECTIEEFNKYLDGVLIIIPYEYKELYSVINSNYKYIGVSNSEEEKNAQTNNTVFINKVLYLDKKDSAFFKYAIMMKEKLNVFDNIEFKDNNNYLLKYEEALKLISEKTLLRTNEISNLCNFKFEKKDNLIPTYKNSFNVSSFEYLSSLSKQGLSIRLKGNVTDIYKNRLLYELDVINKMGFSDYFLIVYDYVRYAKKNNILVGPGRGSAAGSLVAYCLGIIDIDPIKYNLLFERFLNKGRVTMPDIDIDFPDIYREDVIKYVRDKYGKYKVSGIVAVSTLKSRAVLDDVARILKIESDKIDLLKSRINPSQTLKYTYENNSDFKNIIDNDERLKLLYKVSTFFEGFPKNTTVHASGIIISNTNLTDVIPLIKDENLFLSAFEMGYLEELGLLKMDFLGNRNLTIVMNILDSIEKYDKEKVSFLDIPMDDIETIKLFENKDTNGIFQFESNAMKSLLERLKPKNFEQLIAANALVRPGPDTDSYINRKNNGQKIEYLDEKIKNVLKDTYGVLVYQEQIMQIASVMAGFSLEEADNLRRAMGKKKREILENAYKSFIDGSIKNGYNIEDAKKMYEDILAFSSYGFNKAHAVAYTTLAYKMAYLKVHYSKHFYINILSNLKGDKDKASIFIKEAKKRKVEFLLPDINKSSYKFEIIDNKVLFPLSLVKGISENIAKDIIYVRGDSFKDIYDALSKLVSLNINENIIENLIYLSAFSCFKYNIRTLIENLDNLLNYAYITIGIQNNIIERPNIEIKEEYSRDFLMNKEKNLLGYYLSYHPTISYKEEYKAVNIIDLNKYLGRYVNVAIIIEKIKEIKDKNGNEMAFILGSDDTDDVEITFFKDEYKTIKGIKRGQIIIVNGKVTLHGSIKIIAQKSKIIT